MKRNAALLITLALSGFIVGFILTLTVHWHLRPTADQSYTIENNRIAELDTPTRNSNALIKSELKDIEDRYYKLNDEHRMVEGHARALLNEMQVYRESESELLQTIEQQKELLAKKIEDLDFKIESSLETNALTPQKNDYELVAELTSLLAYPHPLNDLAVLNQALLAQPRQTVDIVKARFEIMLQPEQYDRTNTLYERLKDLKDQAKEGGPNFTVDNIFCNEQACEVQLKVDKPAPYFDSWRWLLDYLAQEPLLKTINNSFSSDSGTEVNGLIILTQ